MGSFPACSLRSDGKLTGRGTESFKEEDDNDDDEDEDEEGILGNGDGTDEEEEENLVEGRERETIPP